MPSPSKTPPSPSSPAGGNDLSITRIVVGGAVTLVALLLMGGYWLQQQRTEQVQQQMQADIYENYRKNTRSAPPTEAPVELPVAYLEAQRNREKLLQHPAVTPGAAFNARGVQATGVAIIDAIDQAKATPR